VSGRLLELQDSGGASAPRAAVRKSKQRMDLERLPPFFLSLPAVTPTVTCKRRKDTSQVSILISFLDLFPSVFFLSLQICFHCRSSPLQAVDGSEFRASVVGLQRPRGVACGRRALLKLLCLGCYRRRKDCWAGAGEDGDGGSVASCCGEMKRGSSSS
jgi:hypothetical protein